MGLRKILFKLVCILMLIILTISLLSGCNSSKTETITSFDDFSKPGIKIGVRFDMLELNTLKANYPNAEIITYYDNHLGYQDVVNGHLDAFVYARIEMEYAIANGVNGVRLLDENYSKYKVGIGLSPVSNIQNLQTKINTFIYELRKDGILDEMFDRWVIQGNQEMPDIKTPENPTFTLKVGTTGTVMPYSFFYGEELRGYDIELAYRFGEWLGANVEFKVYDFAGTISAVSSGDIDCIMSNLYMMDE